MMPNPDVICHRLASMYTLMAGKVTCQLCFTRTLTAQDVLRATSGKRPLVRKVAPAFSRSCAANLTVSRTLTPAMAQAALYWRVDQDLSQQVDLLARLLTARALRDSGEAVPQELLHHPCAFRCDRGYVWQRGGQHGRRFGLPGDRPCSRSDAPGHGGGPGQGVREHVRPDHPDHCHCRPAAFEQCSGPAVQHSGGQTARNEAWGHRHPRFLVGSATIAVRVLEAQLAALGRAGAGFRCCCLPLPDVLW